MNEQKITRLPCERQQADNLKKLRIDYFEGYNQALKDVYQYFCALQSSLRHDRKRNNINHIIWMLEPILEQSGLFADYGKDLPVYFKEDGKRLKYYIKKDEWPIKVD